MSKRMYMIPETETAPLSLSACIMSGVGGNPDLGNNNGNVNNGSDFESQHAPRKVF